MLAKQQVLDDLEDALKSHLAKTVDNVLTTALDDEQLTTAVKRFAKGLHHSRVFYEKAVVAIEAEFKVPS